MLLTENKYVNISSTFPNAILIDASGPGLTDGSELVALNQNDGFEAFQQPIMDYAAGGVNNPTGSVGVPNGVSEATGISQMILAMQRAYGVGPGTYVQLDNAYDPVAKGDRIITLAEQGVLIAVYPDLDRERWIGGNTAAQVAAEAAGEKFYRSSDSGGAIGDAAGPYLQLPANIPTFQKQYSEANGDFTVTGATWTTNNAVAIPYKTSDGTWRLIFNIKGTITTNVTITITMSGITNIPAHHQSISISTDSAGRPVEIALAIAGGGTFTGRFSVTSTGWYFSGDIEIASKPTWADDYETKLGIRY